MYFHCPVCRLSPVSVFRCAGHWWGWWYFGDLPLWIFEASISGRQNKNIKVTPTGEQANRGASCFLVFSNYFCFGDLSGCIVSCSPRVLTSFDRVNNWNFAKSLKLIEIDEEKTPCFYTFPQSVVTRRSSIYTLSLCRSKEFYCISFLTIEPNRHVYLIFYWLVVSNSFGVDCSPGVST